jgi:hypothetical protein
MADKKDEKSTEQKQRDEKWIETPGLAYVRDYLVAEAVESLRRSPDYQPVMIYGKTGVGKSFIRDMIWREAGFSKSSVAFINAAAITETLFESELYGYKRGAFTGAAIGRTGILGGSSDLVVLDEIGSLPKHSQAKLLTFLDDGKFRRLGEDTTKTSPAKILAITNKNPWDQEIFREDFAHRFHVITIPGLHERRHDVPFLLKRFAPGIRWARYDLLRLMAYNWPGNVRELESFASMVKRYSESITDWTLSGSVLELLRCGSLPGMPPYSTTATSWLPKTVPLGNLPDFIFSDGFDESIAKFCPNLSFFPEFDDIGIDLSELDKLATRTNIHSQSLDGFASARETIQEPYHICKQALSSYDWEREWLLWCDLMGQDPYSKEDLLASIVTGDQTRLPDSPRSGGLKMQDLREILQLKKAIRTEFRRSKEHRIECQPAHAGNTVPTLEEALPIVLAQISMDRYEFLWKEHCDGMKLAEIARKYPDVNKETIKTRLKRFRKDKQLASK